MTIRALFTILILLPSCQWTFGQIEDTTTVQVIQFSDGLENRRAWRYFPPDNTSYRQVLMYQTLKCDPALINNPTGSGCGEWDTGENFYIYDHSHQDSLRYRKGFDYPDSISITSTPTYTRHQVYKQHRVYDQVIKEETFVLGDQSLSLNNVLQGSLHTHRAQYMFRASELINAGLSAGSIDKMKLNIVSLGTGDFNNLKIRIKATSLASLSQAQYESNGLVTVYDNKAVILVEGAHTFNFYEPFMWDGSSNVVVDLSFSNEVSGTNYMVSGSATPFVSGVYSTIDDQCFYFHNKGYIDVETNQLKSKIDSNITVSFWTEMDVKGKTNNMVPFSAVDSGQIYQMLTYLPSNGPRAHWYAGRELGAGLDEIKNTENLSDMSDFTQGWTHWAFTRNSTSTVMTVYRNGEIYLQETKGNSKRVLDRIEEFRIAGDRNSNNRFYSGKLNEFQIWNKELDQLTIRNWMHKDLDGSHPFYDNLVGYFRFEGDHNRVATDETGTSKTSVFGLPTQHYIPGDQRFRNLQQTSQRPNITFVQGDYQSHIDSTLSVVQTENPATSVVVSENLRDLSLIGMQDVEIDTLYVWEAGRSYTLDQQGEKVDSIFVPAEKTLFNYYIGRQMTLTKYITPYGNNLDLGDGFTWIYDVTDFESLLHDTIDIQGGGKRELIDLQFKFIEGIPPQDVHSLQFLKNVGGKYADIVAHPDRFYNTIYPNENSDRFGIRASFSGHGFNNATNCSEFCRRNHFIEIGGKRIYEWVHWKECSDNPLYPQGGTWIYDRTGWCPGAPQDIYHFDLTPYVKKGESDVLFKGVDPDPTGEEFGNWGGFMYFISYGHPNFVNDATVYKILAPSNADEHLRFNPICDNAIIELRNNGSANMTSAVIQYGVEGGEIQAFNWKGSLAFMETEKVILPMHAFDNWWGDELKFNAKVVMVNGVIDEYEQNSANHSYYTPPPQYPADLELFLRTNREAWQTTWTITDGLGNIFYEGSGLENNTLYREDISLPVGCYTFIVVDSADNGLSFWANNDGGGFCQFRNKMTGAVLENFNADFGDNIRFEFSIGDTITQHDKNRGHKSIHIFPNPSGGKYNVAMDNYTNSQVTIDVYDVLGKKLVNEQSAWVFSDRYLTKIDLTGTANGVYIIRFNTADGPIIRKVIKR